MLGFLAQNSQRIGDPIWGVIIPAIILAGLFPLTWWLYMHFAGEEGKKKGKKGRPKKSNFKKALHVYFWGE